MIGVVVAAHGDVADAFVKAAADVLDLDVPALAVGLRAEDTSDTYALRLRQAIKSAKSEHGVLVLTDMFGGTPSNVSLTCHETGEVEVVTGVNLPMLLKALTLGDEEMSLSNAAAQVQTAGNRAITYASGVLAPAGDEETP